MPSLASTLALATLLIPALTSPLHTFSPRDSGNQCHKSDWCSKNNKDSVYIMVTDERIDWGNVDPRIMQENLLKACDSGICKDDVEVESKFIGNNQLDMGKFKIKVSTQVLDPKHVGPMIKAAKEVLHQLKESREENYLTANVCPVGQCPSSKHKDWQHKVPAGITIQRRGTDKEDLEKSIYDRPIVSSLTLTFESKRDKKFGGVCGPLAGVGAAAAGLVNPILGVVGAVGAMGCLAAP